MPVTRIGVVGTGDIGRIHARSLAKAPDVRVVVVQGGNSARAADLAREVGGDTAPSYEALLEDSTIVGVSVCVPNDLHAQYAVAALDAGKTVLCEKPIALSLDDARRMKETSRRSGRRLVVGHSLRFWPEYVQARDLALRGAIGRVQSFSARRLVPLLRAVTGENGWRHIGDRSGGAVLDLQVHDIDYVLWTFGPPSAVTSRGVRSHTGAIDHVFTLLDYDSGPTVAIESSFMLQGNPVTMDFRAIGTEGSFEFSFVETEFAMHDIHGGRPECARRRPDSLTLYRWGQHPEVLAQQAEDPITALFDAELRAFVACVRGEDAAMPSVDEAIDALRVALASRESCVSGRTVSVGRCDQGS